MSADSAIADIVRPPRVDLNEMLDLVVHGDVASARELFEQYCELHGFESRRLPIGHRQSFTMRLDVILAGWPAEEKSAAFKRLFEIIGPTPRTGYAIL